MKMKKCTVISIQLAEHLVSALLDGAWVLAWVQLQVRVYELGALDQAITVLIELGESLAHLVFLLLGGQVRGQVRHRRLDHLRVAL